MFEKWHVNKNILSDEKDKIVFIDNWRRARGKSSRYTLWNATISREDIKAWRKEMGERLDISDPSALQHARGIRDGAQAASGFNRDVRTTLTNRG